MALRLVVDVIRRKWMAIGFAVAQVYLFRQASWNIWRGSDPMAWLLAFAAFVTITTGMVLQSREIYQLPVSRRTLWLARWWLSTAGVVLLVQPAVSLAQWTAESHAPPVDELAMSTLWAFLYCGCVTALAATQFGPWADKPLEIQPASPAGHARPPVVRVNLGWVIFKAFLRVVPGMFALLTIPVVAPFVFTRYLSHAFSSINSASLIAMLAMTLCSAWGYLHQPPIQARRNQRIARAPVARRDSKGADQTAEKLEHRTVAKGQRFIDKLTGLRLPLWQASRKYLITYSTVIALGIAWWWVTSFYKTVPDLPTLLGRIGMLPLASPRANVVEGITVGALFIIGGMLEVGLIANIRPLRVLPLSTTQLCCIPLGLGLLSASMLWIVFLALHLLVLHTLPISFRIDLFTAFVSLAALTHVLRFTVPGQPPARAMIGFAPLGVLWLALGYFDTFRTNIVQPAMFGGGLLVIAASFVMMRRAVTRSSQIYRRASATPF